MNCLLCVEVYLGSKEHQFEIIYLNKNKAVSVNVQKCD